MSYGTCTLDACPKPTTCVDAVHHSLGSEEPCQCGVIHFVVAGRGTCEECGWVGPKRQSLEETRRDYAFHETIERIHRGRHLTPDQDTLDLVIASPAPPA